MFRLVVLSVSLAVVTASPITFWGNGLIRPLAAPWSLPLASPIYNPLVAPFGDSVGVPNYRGPLSLAPGQPANILGADGRPLDTLSVNLDRVVHNTARAVENSGRRLQKRSVLAAPVISTHLGGTHYGAGALAAIPLAATHLTLGRTWVGPAPVAPIAISAAAPWGY